MNVTKKVMTKEGSMGLTRFSTSSVTLPPVYENKVATVAANPFEPIYSELSDIKMMLRLLLEQRTPVAEKSDLMNVDEAAAFLHLNKQTIYGRVSKSTIPYFKAGKRLYFSKPDLNKWIMSDRHRTIVEIENDIDENLSRIMKAAS